MKLRNKETGEIGYLHSDSDNQVQVARNSGYNYRYYNSLAELNDEWEDYEEPEEDRLDNIIALVEAYSNHDSERYPKEIIDKLKAWKRLKDKGVEFYGWRKNHTGTYDFLARWRGVPPKMNDIINDLDLLFCTEENEMNWKKN